MDDAALERVKGFLEEHREDMQRSLEELARMETPSLDPASQKPILDALECAFREMGFRTLRISGRETGGHLYARPGDRRRGTPFQLLVGHCDTVWPRGTLKKMGLEMRDDRLYGPGVFDMKGGLVQLIFALKALRAAGVEPEVTPVVFINSDEEIGSRESRRHIIRLARRADRALVLEGPLGLDGKLKTARKGLGRFTVNIQGRAAHAGVDPEKGASAILELSSVIQKLFALNDPEQGVTVNVGTIDGGIRPNVVAPTSEAVVDVRVPTRRDAERLEAAIRGIRPSTPGTSIDVTGRFGRPPMVETEGNRRLFEEARRIGEHLDLNLESCMAGGGSDANWTSLHTPTLDGLGALGAGAHSVQEFIVPASMVPRTALLAGLIALPAMSESAPSGSR